MSTPLVQRGAACRGLILDMKDDMTDSAFMSSTSGAARRSREAVTRYRERMRRQGLRLVQFWAPDVSVSGFAEECRRQSALASAAHRHERTILREIGALSTGLDLGSAPDFIARPPRGRR